MEFGQLGHNQKQKLETLSFILPTDSPSNLQTLSTYFNPEKNPQIRLGGPIWGVPEWVGKIYPKKTPQSEFLRSYSQVFHTVEMNSTFYALPQKNQMLKWRDAVSENKSFRFLPKVWKSISHDKKLINCREELTSYIRTILPLGESLGASMLQLPPSFHFRFFPSLQKFIQLFPKELKLAVEFRHPSWFNKGNLIPSVSDFLNQSQVSTIITDTTTEREILHSTLSQSHTLVRFLGNDLHFSDYTRIQDWVEKCIYWIEMGLQEMDFIIHQPNPAFVPDLLGSMAEQLTQSLELPILGVAKPNSHESIANSSSILPKTKVTHSEQMTFQF